MNKCKLVGDSDLMCVMLLQDQVPTVSALAIEMREHFLNGQDGMPGGGGWRSGGSYRAGNLRYVQRTVS